MSGSGNTCARTRGWNTDFYSSKKYTSNMVRTKDKNSADSDTDKSDNWSELQASSFGCASEPSDNDNAPRVLKPVIVKELIGLEEDDKNDCLESVEGQPFSESRNVNSTKQNDLPSLRNENSKKHERSTKDDMERILKMAEADADGDRSERKSSHRKHRDIHHSRDRDPAKDSKKKDTVSKHSKSKDKSLESSDIGRRDDKRKYEELSERKSHKRDKKSEKYHKRVGNSDDEFVHRQEKKHDSFTMSREKISSHERRRDHKRAKPDDTSDEEHSQRKEKYWDSSKMHHSKDLSKADTGKDRRRSKHDLDEQVIKKGRSHSRSPRSHKFYSFLHGKESGRSSSSHHMERQEREKTESDKNDKEGGPPSPSFENKYKRFGVGSSRLGGYSPRRRLSESGTKTPSPPPKSPERRKVRAWDLPPVGIDTSMVAAMAAVQQAAVQQAAVLASTSPFVTVNPAVTAVTLTQATRPFRRLYIANVPATVSDGELLEFLNAVMLSANANYLPGTKPCISSLVNTEKNYAFAEFLTPEDATAALAFDGVTLHGTTLKIRRPKDYVQPSNGGVDKLSPAVDMVSNAVVDSPQKVFVGGICSSLSSNKVKEIVTAFGQLKAYHWEVCIEKGKKEAFAFLEYLDPSVTLKACAGLNGMRLGNRILTVMQATPNADLEVGDRETPFYGVPEQAKSLLEIPTRILELQNVITDEELSAMSEVEINEFAEDIRLECLRFGTVKSMHIVMPKDSNIVQKVIKADQIIGGQEAVGLEDPAFKENEIRNQDFVVELEKRELAEVEVSVEKPPEVLLGISSNEEQVSRPIEEPDSKYKLQEDSKNDICVEESSTLEQSAHNNVKIGSGEDATSTVTYNCILTESTANSIDVERNSSCLDADVHNLSAEPGNGVGSRESQVGMVYVEFSREECVCQAAHNLHGRIYVDRKVVAHYFPLKLYQKRFRKGLVPQTIEEKQALALAAQEHLNSYIKD